MTFRPLLAEKADLSILKYPVYASPKYDGYRCLISAGGLAISRNMKLIPNAYVAAKLQEHGLPQLDGELLTYTNDKVDDFNVVQSKLSSRSGRPDFKYMVFDDYTRPEDPYYQRYTKAAAYINSKTPKHVELVEQKWIDNEEGLLEFEAQCLALGWEGVMARSMEGHYKFGRSTTKEGVLLKLKRFFDAEATVVSMHELLHNANEGVVNELGYTERSSHKSNMQGMGVLGKFTVDWNGTQFDVGTGFNGQQREAYWKDESLVGKTITFRYQSVGHTGKPRFPVFLGFRHDL